MKYLQYFLLFAGLWSLVNGILHDIFVLRQHRSYDRDLIRLLIDGHILIFAGILFLICTGGIKNGSTLAFNVSIIVSIFLLGYCALIFKMLPSLGTILINLIALVWLIIEYPRS